MLFVLVKNELLEGELDGVVACSWGVQAPRKLHFEFARLSKGSLYGPHLAIGCGHLQTRIAAVVTWQEAVSGLSAEQSKHYSV